MIYSIKDGKLIPAEKPENHRYNNLPAGFARKIVDDCGTVFNAKNYDGKFLISRGYENMIAEEE